MLVDSLVRLDGLLGAPHFCHFDATAASEFVALLSSLSAPLASSVAGLAASIDEAAAVLAAMTEKGEEVPLAASPRAALGEDGGRVALPAIVQFIVAVREQEDITLRTGLDASVAKRVTYRVSNGNGGDAGRSCSPNHHLPPLASSSVAERRHRRLFKTKVARVRLLRDLLPLFLCLSLISGEAAASSPPGSLGVLSSSLAPAAAPSHLVVSLHRLLDGECAGDCDLTSIGDGFCDIDCYTASCNFDGGDCGEEEGQPDECAREYSCPFSLRGDGQCDHNCNHAVCNFDKGDCGDNCTAAFKCRPSWRGDGRCNSKCDNDECGFDGGDCAGYHIVLSLVIYSWMLAAAYGYGWGFFLWPMLQFLVVRILGMIGDARSRQLVTARATERNHYLAMVARFYTCRKQLTDAWRKGPGMSLALEEFPKVDKIELPGPESFDEKMRQTSLSGAVVQNSDELYIVAASALPSFEFFLRNMLRTLKLPERYLFITGLKGKARAEEKARDDYSSRRDGPGIAWIFDIVRGSIICDSTDHIHAILKYLFSRDELMRLKNRFKKPQPSGCRDFNLNLRIKVPSQDGRNTVFHMCELQIHYKILKELNEELHAHEVYEFFREYFKGNMGTVENRLDLMNKIFAGGSNLPTFFNYDDERVSSEGAAVRPADVPSSIQLLASRVMAGNDIDSFHAATELFENMCEFNDAISVQRNLLGRIDQTTTFGVSVVLHLADLLLSEARWNQDDHEVDLNIVFRSNNVSQALGKPSTMCHVEGHRYGISSVEPEEALTLYKSAVTRSGGTVHETVLFFESQKWAPVMPQSPALQRNLLQAIAGCADCISVGSLSWDHNQFHRASHMYREVIDQLTINLGPNHFETLKARKKLADHFFRHRELQFRAMTFSRFFLAVWSLSGPYAFHFAVFWPIIFLSFWTFIWVLYTPYVVCAYVINLIFFDCLGRLILGKEEAERRKFGLWAAIERMDNRNASVGNRLMILRSPITTYVYKWVEVFYTIWLGVRFGELLQTMFGCFGSVKRKWDAAKEECTRVREAQLRSIGKDHPHTLDTLRNLGVLYEEEGDLIRAKQTFEEVGVSMTKIYGPGHVATKAAYTRANVIERLTPLRWGLEHVVRALVVALQWPLYICISSLFCALAWTFCLAVIVFAGTDFIPWG